MSSLTGETRHRRADAVANRERILEAAEVVFSAEGVAVPIDRVAERAGVGVGTVYRHFPTKEDLFEAIVMTRLEGLLVQARAAVNSADADQAFFSFLHEFASVALAKHDLYDAMGAAGLDLKARCGAKLEEMKDALGLLLSRAQSTGAVRTDISVEEVLGLVVGSCQAAALAGMQAPGCMHMVDVVCDGIRTPAREAR